MWKLHSGSSLESKRKNLVKNSNEDTELELSILCNQIRLPVVELGYQPSHTALIYNVSCIQMILGNGGTTL